MSSITRMDIVDIELNSGNVHRSWLNHSIGSGDNNANAFGVRLFRNSEPVDIGAGWVQGFFRNSQGQNIALTENGVIDGNVTYVTLPQACYNYEGQFTLAIKLVSPGFTSTVTMRIVDGIVDNTNTGGAVAPTGTVPTYQEILAVYAEMQEDIADYESVVATQNGKIDDLKSAINGIREHTKNLYDPDNVLIAYAAGEPTDIRYNAGCRVVWIPCEKNKTYTVSKTAGTRFAIGYTKTTPALGVLVYGFSTGYTSSSLTITTGADAKFLVSWVYNSGSDSITAEEMLASVQIELGSSATSYEPPYSAIDRIIRSKAFTSLGILDAGTDLNNVRSYKGYYLLSYSGSYDNDPVGANKRRYLMCFPFNETPVLLQVIFNATDGIIYQRFFASNTWGGWKSTKVETFENYGTLPNGTDLDTLYGIDGFYTMGVNSVYGHDPVGTSNRRLLTCYKKETFTHQILFNSTTGDIYQRVYALNSWSKWKRNADQTQEICGSYTDRICTSHAGVFSNSKYQNSPKAFKDARKLGIMYQELDVVFTKDLVPIVSHSSFADNAMDASTTPPTPITSEFRFKNYTLEQLKENYVFGDADYYWTIMTLAEAYALLQDLGCRVIVDVGGGHNNPTGSRELLCSYMIENGIQCEGLITSECTGDYEHDTFGILCETGGEKFPLGVVVAASTSDDLTTAVAKINAIISAKSDLNLEKAWCFVRRERMASGGDLLSYVETLRNAGVKIAGYSYDASTYSIDIPTFFSLVISGSVNINYLRYLDAMNS
jgi:hypothetical protein